jgi:hypothetical protein
MTSRHPQPIRLPVLRLDTHHAFCHESNVDERHTWLNESRRRFSSDAERHFHLREPENFVVSEASRVRSPNLQLSRAFVTHKILKALFRIRFGGQSGLQCQIEESNRRQCVVSIADIFS